MQGTKDIMQSVARNVDGALNPAGKRNGFVVLVFPLNQSEGARTNYVSNCDREDIITAMKEIIARFEGRVTTTETKQ